MTTNESSDLNESNLNFLNEEASRFKEEEEVADNEPEELLTPELNKFGRNSHHSFDDGKQRDKETNFLDYHQNYLQRNEMMEKNSNYNVNPNSNSNISNIPYKFVDLKSSPILDKKFTKSETQYNNLSQLNQQTNLINNQQTKLLENFSKELNERKHKIEFLQEQNSEKDILIENLRKNIKTLQDKLQKNTKNLQNRQINEIESELKLLGVEYIKLQETVNNKDKIINEFSKLSENTKTKFKMFEDANRILQDENEILNKTIEDYKISLIPRLIQSENLKENQIKDLKELLSEYEKKTEKEKIELIKKEENLRSKYEEKEITLKAKFKEREENLKNEYFKEIVELNSNVENVKNENEKLKSELKVLKHKVEEKENEIQIKEFENAKNLDKIEKENEKLKRNIRDLESEIRQKEEKFEEKIENLSKQYGEKEKHFNSTISLKEKKISSQEDELNKNRSQILNLQSQLKEEEFKNQNLEEISKQLKNQNSEILNEMNLQKNNFTEIEENKEKEVYQILLKLNEIVEEKNELEELNEELKKNLKLASDKIRELNELILDKYQGIELSFYKEKSHKEYLEKKYRDAFKSMKSEEEKLREELNSFKTQFEKKNEETEKIKIKYENKIQSLRLKLDEESYCRENIQEELDNLKSNFGVNLNLNSISPKPYYYEDPPVRLDKKNPPQFPKSNMDTKLKNFRNPDDVLQLQTLDNFKELIYKMDEKLGETVNMKFDNNIDYFENKVNESRADISLNIPFGRLENNLDDQPEGLLIDSELDTDAENRLETEIEKHIAEIKSAYKF